MRRTRNSAEPKHKPLAPMLVQRTLHNTGMEIREWMAVDAFSKGFAESQHYDLLAYMMNLLLLAGSTDQHRRYASEYADNVIRPALQGIADRYNRTGRFGVDSSQLKVLREMIEFSKQFWLRQPTELFEKACLEVDAFFKERAENRHG